MSWPLFYLKPGAGANREYIDGNSVAGAQTGGCGIDFGGLVCMQFHRYGQYLVALAVPVKPG